MEPIDVLIESDEADSETSSDLQALAADYRQANIEADITEETQPSDGKDGGLIIAITLGDLILTGVATLIGVLQLWLNARPKYTAKLTLDGVELTIESHDINDLKARLEKASSQKSGQNRVRIVVARK